MPRGKMLRTKIKEAILDAQVTAEAVEIAKQNIAQKRHEKKPLWDSAREHIGKMIDRIDPLETAAILASTYLIHETILQTETLIQPINKKLDQNPPLFIATFLNPVAGWIGELLPSGQTEQIQNAKAPDSFILWVISFVLAFIIVRYGKDIIKSGVDLAKSLPSLIGMLGIVI